MRQHPFVCMLYIIVILICLILDQAVKIYVSNNMAPGQSLAVLDNFFYITYIHNDGAAFGILSGHGLFLMLVPAAILACALCYLVAKRKSISRVFGLALSLIVAGGTGNIIDRAVYGYVIDFLDFKVWNPVFNIADIFVCTGCGLMIIYLLFIEGREKRDGRD